MLVIFLIRRLDHHRVDSSLALENQFWLRQPTTLESPGSWFGYPSTQSPIIDRPWHRTLINPVMTRPTPNRTHSYGGALWLSKLRNRGGKLFLIFSWSFFPSMPKSPPSLPYLFLLSLILVHSPFASIALLFFHLSLASVHSCSLPVTLFLPSMVSFPLSSSSFLLFHPPPPLLLHSFSSFMLQATLVFIFFNLGKI